MTNIRYCSFPVTCFCLSFFFRFFLSYSLDNMRCPCPMLFCYMVLNYLSSFPIYARLAPVFSSPSEREAFPASPDDASPDDGPGGAPEVFSGKKMLAVLVSPLWRSHLSSVEATHSPDPTRPSGPRCKVERNGLQTQTAPEKHSLMPCERNAIGRKRMVPEA